MSFREAKDTLALLGCGNISVSKLRTPDGARRVPRTLVVMADGTNPPCTKAATAGARGKDSAQAKAKFALFGKDELAPSASADGFN